MCIGFAGLVDSAAFAQESAPAVPAQDPPAAAAPATPAPVAAAPAAPATVDACQQRILQQQQMARALQNLREPITVLDKNEAAKLRRDYTKLVADGYSAEADSKKVKDYLQFMLLRVTDPEFSAVPSNLQNLLKDVESDMQRAAGNVGNPATQQNARRKFCGDVLEVTKQLLTNSFDSRVTAVSVLKHLHETKAVPGGSAARMHAESLTTLLSVLESDQQPDAVKVFAADAIRNVLRNCDILETDQFRICDGIAKQLADRCSESAYQQTLLEVLFEIRRPRKTIGSNEPTVMKVFASVLDDRQRPIEVRCLAAMGIGRGAYDGQMRLDPLAWKIAQLAGDAAVEFNRSPGDARWPACGASLVFAYRHASAEEAVAAPADRKGLLNRSTGAAPSKVIAESANLVKVVGLGLLKNSDALTREEVLPLAEWLNANKPAELKWDDRLPALTP
ncbi:MAG: hypothetical protein RIT02_4246 [Planctomycetota bacterium]|jgi:hypothetical protein